MQKKTLIILPPGPNSWVFFGTANHRPQEGLDLEVGPRFFLKLFKWAPAGFLETQFGGPLFQRVVRIGMEIGFGGNNLGDVLNQPQKTQSKRLKWPGRETGFLDNPKNLGIGKENFRGRVSLNWGFFPFRIGMEMGCW